MSPWAIFFAGFVVGCVVAPWVFMLTYAGSRRLQKK